MQTQLTRQTRTRAVTTAMGILTSIVLGLVTLRAATLKPGDILITDSGNAVAGGAVLRVDPATGAVEVISSGGYLRLPFAVAIGADGMIVVTDSGRLIRIDPATGRQTIIAENSTGQLFSPWDIDLSLQGELLIANYKSLLRLKIETGTVETVSAGGSFVAVMGTAIGDKGQIYVLNHDSVPQIIRVNPRNGMQKVIAEGGLLNAPQCIALRGDNLYVTDVASADGNFGVGHVLHVDLRNGTQRVASKGGLLVGPVGIVLEDEGHVLVSDPYSVNPASRDRYDGAILRINLATGRQELIARGNGTYVNPRGITIHRQPRRQ